MREIERTILALDKQPLFGNCPSFPWEAVRESLQKRFELDELQFEVRAPEWKEQIDGDLIFLQFPGIESPIAWKMDDSLLQTLTGTEIKDPNLSKGFVQFCALEVIYALERAGFPTFTLLEKGEMKGPFLIAPVNIGIGEHTVYGELIVPEAFHQAWIGYFADQEPTFSDAQKENIRVRVGVQAGHVNLTHPEWKEVKVGDFISLDECTIDLEGSGEVQLALASRPFFKGRLTAEGVELV